MRLFKNRYTKYLLGIVLIGLLVYLAFPKSTSELVISSTTPPNQETNVLPASPIIIKFSEKLDKNMRNSVSYGINPEIKSTSNWIEENSLKIDTTELFTENLTYKVTVYADNEPFYEFAFKTKANKDFSQQDEATVLARGERLYNQSIKEDLQQNPWKAYFPIITEKYTLIYAPSEDSYFVDFLYQFNQDEAGQLKEDIKTKLIDIGAPEKEINYID